MPPTREEATRSPRSQAQRYETQGFWTAHFYFQVLLCVLLPTQCQAKTHVLFQVTCAVISLETMLGTRMAFLLLLSPSCRCINIRVGSVGGKEAHQGLPNHTYNNTAAGNVPPDSKSIPDLGGQSKMYSQQFSKQQSTDRKVRVWQPLSGIHTPVYEDT